VMLLANLEKDGSSITAQRKRYGWQQHVMCRLINVLEQGVVELQAVHTNYIAI
jgi:hypothetical protein